MTPAEVLRRAAEVLGERGWTQRVEIDEVGQCCAQGAIRLAVTGGIDRSPDGVDETELWSEAENALWDHIEDAGEIVDGVAEWNDTHGRTAAEVKAAMLAAAERAS